MKIIMTFSLVLSYLAFGLSPLKAENGIDSVDRAAQVYWDNGTRLELADELFSLKINALVQPRYSFTDSNDSDVSSFSVHRARLILSGDVLDEKFSYYLNADFTGNSSEGERAGLIDAFITWHLHQDFDLRGGRFKVPVSRQFGTSSRALQFPDRSLVSDLSDLGRKDGIATMFDFLGSQAQIGAGIYNSLSSTPDLMDTRHTGAVSLRLNPLGVMNPFEEGDLRSSEEMAVSYGAAYAYGEGGANDALGELERHSLSIDGNLKVAGYSLHGEFFWNRFSSDFMESAEPLGFYFQSGYFIVPQKFELAARYSFLDCDDGRAGQECRKSKDINQASASLNYHWQDYNMKGQLAYDYIRFRGYEFDGMSGTTNRLILQLSTFF